MQKDDAENAALTLRGINQKVTSGNVDDAQLSICVYACMICERSNDEVHARPQCNGTYG